MARIGQMEASRPDLESPCLALSIDAVFSKTLPLDLSIHGGYFGKKGVKTVCQMPGKWQKIEKGMLKKNIENAVKRQKK